MFLLLEALGDNDVAYGVSLFALFHFGMQTQFGHMISSTISSYL